MREYNTHDMNQSQNLYESKFVDEQLADDIDIENMNKEFAKKGIGFEDKIEQNNVNNANKDNRFTPEGEGRIFAFPIYLLGDIQEYCEICEGIREFIIKMDKRYYAMRKQNLDFVSRCMNKNMLFVSSCANIMCEYKPDVMARPIRQALGKMLELMNRQGIILDRLMPYLGSTQMHSVFIRHMLCQSIINNLYVMTLN